eukprot:Tamp_13774.p1 GENE.Tamp_13774~~Tamp_13774.p1  ORF type:complete len:549 (+),score=148.10 Tamp_13774:227-1648(+)
MLAAAWEEMATALANAGDAAAVEALLVQIAPPPGGSGLVVVGRDTRVSSPHLAALVASGVAAAGGAVHDLGVVTTPQVHWAVLRANQASPPAVPALSGYFQEHVAALLTLLPDCKPIDIVVDCANGCGAKSVFDMQAALAASTLPITLHAFNTGGLGQGDAAPDPAFLNAGCGAEFVQKSKALPRAYEETLAAMGGASAGGIDGKVWASFDGDADRVVMFYNDSAGIGLLDGDKMACLLARWIAEKLVAAKLSLSLGVVQTAYANGASTIFLKKALAEVGGSWDIASVATGVKYLHHRALDFDIGVYFEANGHGTVLFSDAARSVIGKTAASERAAGVPLGPASRLEAVSKLINPAIGDALSDLLAVVAVLISENLSIAQMAGMYQDLPSRMTKVLVKDRTLIKTSADETQVLQPDTLQPRINELVAKIELGRSFVRPSGTEDCVRVYAEGASQALADQLAKEVGDQVEEILA